MGPNSYITISAEECLPYLRQLVCRWLAQGNAYLEVIKETVTFVWP